MLGNAICLLPAEDVNILSTPCVCDYLQIYVCMYICHIKCEGVILSLLTDVPLVLHGPAHYMG